VRFNGRVFEAAAARHSRRPPRDLYHSALVAWLPEESFAIEMGPVPGGDGAARGVVAEGAVGSRWAGRLRIFRYEVRRWPGGAIPDIAEAVDSPRPLTRDADLTRRLLDLVAEVPTPIWGRDELGAGEMWNSNSVTAWLIARCGLPTAAIHAPEGGRAPGWHAGVVVGNRR
jgi:hypothetical protein